LEILVHDTSFQAAVRAGATWCPNVGFAARVDNVDVISGSAVDTESDGRRKAHSRGEVRAERLPRRVLGGSPGGGRPGGAGAGDVKERRGIEQRAPRGAAVPCENHVEALPDHAVDDDAKACRQPDWPGLRAQAMLRWFLEEGEVRYRGPSR
jgi:hypothetical protein